MTHIELFGYLVITGLPMLAGLVVLFFLLVDERDC